MPSPSHPERESSATRAASATRTCSPACSVSASCCSAPRSTARSPTLVVAQLIHLESEDPDADIAMYVNSPGGEAYAGLAIYDAMQHIRCDVRQRSSTAWPCRWAPCCSQAAPGASAWRCPAPRS